MYVGSSSTTGGAVISGYSVTVPSGLITTIAGLGSPSLAASPPPLFSSVSAGLGPTPSSTLIAPFASGPDPPLPPSSLPPTMPKSKMFSPLASLWNDSAAISAFSS